MKSTNLIVLLQLAQPVSRQRVSAGPSWPFSTSATAAIFGSESGLPCGSPFHSHTTFCPLAISAPPRTCASVSDALLSWQLLGWLVVRHTKWDGTGSRSSLSTHCFRFLYRTFEMSLVIWLWVDAPPQSSWATCLVRSPLVCFVYHFTKFNRPNLHLCRSLHLPIPPHQIPHSGSSPRLVYRGALCGSEHFSPDSHFPTFRVPRRQERSFFLSTLHCDLPIPAVVGMHHASVISYCSCLSFAV